jgi:DNA polymerase-3 subunit beta
MQFTILRSYLLKGLNIVSKGLSNKEVRLINKYISFSLNKKGLTLLASNSQLGIQYHIPLTEGDLTIITIFKEGSFLLEGQLILDVIRKLDNDTVEFDQNDNSVKVQDATANFDLNILSDEYPNIDFNEKGTQFSIDGPILSDLVNKTSFAVSTNEIKPILTGINFDAKNGSLAVSATDQRRISRIVTKIEQTLLFNITIPARQLIDVSRILESDKNIGISVTQKKIIFNVPNLQMFVLLLSGPFPEITRVIPKESKYKLSINSSNLIKTIDRVSVFTTENPGVKLTISKDQFFINAKDNEKGNSISYLHDYQFEGDLLIINMQTKSFVEALRTANEEDVEIDFTSDVGIVNIRNPKNPDIIQLIMPIR